MREELLSQNVGAVCVCVCVCACADMLVCVRGGPVLQGIQGGKGGLAGVGGALFLGSEGRGSVWGAVSPSVGRAVLCSLLSSVPHLCGMGPLVPEGSRWRESQASAQCFS